MGSVFGVPIRFHFTFILLMVLLTVFGFNGSESGLIQVFYLAMLFLSVLLHEIGHALVSTRFGIRTIEIIVFPIGGIARLERQPKPKEELWIALAGPMVNLIISLASSVATGVVASLFHPASARPQWFFQALRVRGGEIFPPDKGA